MSKVSDISELISDKNEALSEAISQLEWQRTKCPEGCEEDGSYHWRGCEVNLNPVIKRLAEAMIRS